MKVVEIPKDIEENQHKGIIFWFTASILEFPLIITSKSNYEVKNRGNIIPFSYRCF